MQSQLFFECGAQTRPPQRSQRILVLSDDLKFCALIRSYLQDCELSVFTCATTARAEMTFLNRCELDLWVIDVMALGRKALSVAERVSELSPEVPVLIVEGYSPHEWIPTTFMRDGWRAVKKSVELTGVLTQIHRLLGSSAAAVAEPAMK